MKPLNHFISKKIDTLSVEKEKYISFLQRLYNIKEKEMTVSNHFQSDHQFHTLVINSVSLYSSNNKDEKLEFYQSLFASEKPRYVEPDLTSVDVNNGIEEFLERIAKFYYFATIEEYKESLEKKIKKIIKNLNYLYKLLSQSGEIDKRKLFRSITKFNIKASEDADNSFYIILKQDNINFNNNIKSYNNDNREYKRIN